MERYPHTQQGAVIETLPKRFKGVSVKEGQPEPGNPHAIEGYTFDRALNTLLYLRPSSEAMAANHVMRLTMKPALKRGAEIFDFLKTRIRDGYCNKPGLPIRAPDRPQSVPLENLIVLPSTAFIRQGLVDFSIVDEVMVRKVVSYIKPHPDTEPDIMEALVSKYPNQILPKEDMLCLYMRSFKRIWITSQSEAGIAAIFFEKPYEFIDNRQCTAVTPSYRSLYRGIATSPTKASYRDKLIRCFSYPESGLIAVGTGFEEDDIKRFFTQYVLHNHVT